MPNLQLCESPIFLNFITNEKIKGGNKPPFIWFYNHPVVFTLESFSSATLDITFILYYILFINLYNHFIHRFYLSIYMNISNHTF